MVSYVARSVGIPARQSGTPCWNSVFEGVDFRGRAADNANVTMCWHAGLNSKGSVDKGGINSFLNNHNWAEIWQSDGSWAFHNVPPGSKAPNSPSLCDWTEGHGCGWSEDHCTLFVFFGNLPVHFEIPCGILFALMPLGPIWRFFGRILRPWGKLLGPSGGCKQRIDLFFGRF